MKPILLAAAMVLSTTAFAGTYYIDSATGLDANNGTSKATPWAHSPRMGSCTSNCAAYTPAPGDQFIFKGGSIWLAASMPMAMYNSGSPGKSIYYGVDTTWYSGTNSGTVNTNGTTVYWASGNAFYHGGAWDGGSITINGSSYTISRVLTPYCLILTTSAGTQGAVSYSNSLFKRPIMNGQGSVPGQIFITSNVAYITVDGIEVTGEMMNSTTAESVTLQGSASGNILLENLDVHNWNRCTGSGAPTSFCTSAIMDNSGSGGGIYVGLFGGLSGTNISLQYSNVGNPENGGNIGACTRGVQILIGNYLHDCSQACLHGCQLVHDNVVYNVGNTFDGTTHTNVFYSDCFDGSCSGALSTATAYLYNNWVIDSQGNAAASGGAAYPNPGTSGTTTSVTYYVFNNVVSCSASNKCITTMGDEIDPYNASGSFMANIYDWNNTYQLSPTGTCVNVVSRPSTTEPNIVDVRNLQCIIAQGGNTFNSTGTRSSASSNVLLQTLTAANTQGYAAASWGPASGSTAGVGTNLSSYCSGALTALCSETTLGGTRAATNPRPSGTTPWDIGAYVSLAAIVFPPSGVTVTGQ